MTSEPRTRFDHGIFDFPTAITLCPFDGSDWHSILLDNDGIKATVTYHCETVANIDTAGAATLHQSDQCVRNEVVTARSSESDLRRQLQLTQGQVTVLTDELADANRTIDELRREVDADHQPPRAVAGTISIQRN